MGSSALMVALGYPGEVQDEAGARFFWWALAMVPFCYVVFRLVAGLNEATSKQPEEAKGLVTAARYLTVVSWLTYPGVYLIKMAGISGALATAYEQIGYSIADVVAKAVFGVLIWAIAAAKTEAKKCVTALVSCVVFHCIVWEPVFSLVAFQTFFLAHACPHKLSLFHVSMGH